MIKALNSFIEQRETFIHVLLSALVILIIPLSILALGYSPLDDSLRHTAHALDSRPWHEVVIQTSQSPLDTNPGWDFILRTLHRTTGWDQEGLLTFSVAFLSMLFMFTGLILLRSPVAWIGALAACAVMGQSFIDRMMLGRPFLLTASGMMVLMAWWNSENKQVRPLKIIATILLFAFIAWIHGSWYLLVLIPMAFLLCGRFRDGLFLMVSFLAGAAIAAVMTGHPVLFLAGQIRHALVSFGQHSIQRQLVTEFRAASPHVITIIAVVILLLAMMILAKKRFRDLVTEPLFILFLVGMMLGISVRRFWLDWGMYAGVLWFAFHFRTLHTEYAKKVSALFGVGMLSVLLVFLFLTATADVKERWTRPLELGRIDGDNPSLQEWLPGDDGIIYADRMSAFFQTYFANPHKPWRYILGYESGLMPKEDLEVLRNIQWTRGDNASYAPWIAKMRPQDRMIMLQNTRPAIGGLEWHLASKSTWIGRKTTPDTSDILEQSRNQILFRRD